MLDDRLSRKLPIVDAPKNCDACGACCLVQGSPPLYLAILDGLYLGEDEPERQDRERVKSLPPDALEAMLKYKEYLRAHRGADDDGPCVWYDHDARNCKWYEHRPSICREFEAGSDVCLDYRLEAGIFPPAAAAEPS